MAFLLIAAFTLATAPVIASQSTNPNTIDVTKDLLLIYNTKSKDSRTVLNYYLANRPGVRNANVLGIGFPGLNVSGTNWYESITPKDFTNDVLVPIGNWLANNPAKRPQYVILFLDAPSRVSRCANKAANYPFYCTDGGNYPSVQYWLHTNFPGWTPFVTSINMNGVADCTNYINKLKRIDTSNSLVISAKAGGYGNTNFYFDDALAFRGMAVGLTALQGVTSNGVSISTINYVQATNKVHITSGTNVAGYFSWGYNAYMGRTYYTNVFFHGHSGWYIIETGESFNGQRGPGDQGNFLLWFSPIAFGGTNYSNTPIGAVTHVDEPFLGGLNSGSIYFGQWAAGTNFAMAAWNSCRTSKFQAVGDPFVTQ